MHGLKFLAVPLKIRFPVSPFHAFTIAKSALKATPSHAFSVKFSYFFSFSYLSSIASGSKKAGFLLEQHDNVLPKFLEELIPHQVLQKAFGVQIQHFLQHRRDHFDLSFVQ
jgi:hypothetical protein